MSLRSISAIGTVVDSVYNVVNECPDNCVVAKFIVDTFRAARVNKSRKEKLRLWREQRMHTRVFKKLPAIQWEQDFDDLEDEESNADDVIIDEESSGDNVFIDDKIKAPLTTPHIIQPNIMAESIHRPVPIATQIKPASFSVLPPATVISNDNGNDDDDDYITTSHPAPAPVNQSYVSTAFQTFQNSLFSPKAPAAAPPMSQPSPSVALSKPSSVPSTKEQPTNVGLPAVSVANLGKIKQAFKTEICMKDLWRIVASSNFMIDLLELGKTCEQQQNSKALEDLFGIVQAIFTIYKYFEANKLITTASLQIVEVLFTDPHLLNLVHILQHKPRNYSKYGEKPNMVEQVGNLPSGVSAKICQNLRINFALGKIFGDGRPGSNQTDLEIKLQKQVSSNLEYITTVLWHDSYYLNNIAHELNSDYVTADIKHEILLYVRILCDNFFHVQYQTSAWWVDDQAPEKIPAFVYKLFDVLILLLNNEHLQIRQVAAGVIKALSLISPYMLRHYATKVTKFALPCLVNTFLSSTDLETAETLELILWLFIGGKTKLVAEHASLFCKTFLSAFLEVNITNLKMLEILYGAAGLVVFCLCNHKRHLPRNIQAEDIIKHVHSFVHANTELSFLAVTRFFSAIAAREEFAHIILNNNLMDDLVSELEQHEQPHKYVAPAICAIINAMRGLDEQVFRPFLDKFESTLSKFLFVGPTVN